MDYIVRLVLIAITAALVNNFVLIRFLGICPFLGVSQKIQSAAGMGMAVSFVMAMASALTWMAQKWLLDPLGIGFLQTIAFILVIAALVQFVEMVLKKTNPALYRALGVYLPLITTNCAVLGVAILNIESSYDLLESVVSGAFGAFLTDGEKLVALFEPSVRYQLIEEYGLNCYTVAEDGRLRLEVGFTNRDFIIRWILGFGEKVRVLEPPSIAEDLRRIAEKMLETYVEHDAQMSGSTRYDV